jgi:hypothetical protein
MSLSFNFEKIINHKEVCYDDGGDIRPVTELLIFTCMHTGIGEITEANAAEFYARMIVAHKLYDIGIVTPDGTEPLKPEHVHQHIGLRTNVGMMETRAAWGKRFITDKRTGLLSELAYNYKKELAIA